MTTRSTCCWLHGWGLHSEFFHCRWAPLLALHCRIHLIDLPGHGHSPAVTPYSLDAMAAALPTPCEVTGSYAVAGWSLGGAVALKMAILFPETVKPSLRWRHRRVFCALTTGGTRPPDTHWSCCAPGLRVTTPVRWRSSSNSTWPAATASRLTIWPPWPVKRPAVQPDVLVPGVVLTSGVDLRSEVAAIRALCWPSPAVWIVSATASPAPGWRRRPVAGTLNWRTLHAPHLSHGSEVAKHMLQHLARRMSLGLMRERESTRPACIARALRPRSHQLRRRVSGAA